MFLAGRVARFLGAAPSCSARGSDVEPHSAGVGRKRSMHGTWHERISVDVLGRALT